MKDFLRILRRFVPPYKKFMVWNVIFNILSAILNLFSFALIIPILNILFKISDETYVYTDWTFAPFSFEAWKATPELLKNNFFWFVSDMIETKGGSFTLIILGVFLIVSTFLKVGTMYMAFYTMIPIRTGVVRDIRNQINRKITELPLGFFSEERKGDIIARVSGDVNEIETSIMSSLDMLFKNPILILIYLIGMIAISWQLTLFVFILLPIAGYAMGQVGKKLKRKSFEGQQQWGYLMSQIEETLGGLRVIKAFNAEEKIQERFEKSNETFRRLTNRIYRRQQMAHPMSEFLGTATIAIVLWYGGTLILSSNSPIDASTFIYTDDGEDLVVFGKALHGVGGFHLVGLVVHDHQVHRTVKHSGFQLVGKLDAFEFQLAAEGVLSGQGQIDPDLDGIGGLRGQSKAHAHGSQRDRAQKSTEFHVILQKGCCTRNAFPLRNDRRPAGTLVRRQTAFE